MERKMVIIETDRELGKIFSELDPTTCYKWDHQISSVGHGIFRTTGKNGKQHEIIVKREYNGNNTLLKINGKEFVIPGFLDVYKENMCDLRGLYKCN